VVYRILVDKKGTEMIAKVIVTSDFFIIARKRLFTGSGKPGKLGEFCFGKFVSTLRLIPGQSG